MMKLLLSISVIILLACNSESNNAIAFENKKEISNDTTNLKTEIRSMMRNLLYQTKITKSYDASYYSLNYPNGDIEWKTGVCTDVIIRSMRSVGVDLQKLVHEDMILHFAEYPALWSLKTPDTNIDHRRVQNLQKFFSNRHKDLKISNQSNDFKPGDIVAWKLSNGLVHIGMVYTIKEDGIPLVVHNIGEGAKIENVLFNWTMIGHYRWFK